MLYSISLATMMIVLSASGVRYDWISAMYTVSLATAMKVRREYEVRVGGYGTSVGGYGRIWELGTIWDFCGRMWEDMGAQDDWNLCGRIREDI